MKIPAAKPQIGADERAAVDRVLCTGNLAQGVEVRAFECEFSDAAVQGLECVAVNSGTSALHLILIALGIGSGDEVLVPSFTFAATANAVAMTGANPVFVDVTSDTFTMDPIDLQSKVTSRSKAVIPVHLYGQMAHMPEIEFVARTHGLKIIEDAAQAHMASLNGRFAGTWGDAAAFSFYPTKNMTSGEGGMVVTRSAAVARTVRLLRNQGQEVRYQNEIVGLNNRMTDIHAAIGRVQLRKLPEWNIRRRRRAVMYNEKLVGVVTPSSRPGSEHVYHQYTVVVPDGRRDELAERLGQRGIGTGVYYPTPVHLLPAFRSNVSLPVSEALARQVLSLPVYPSLDEEDLETVALSMNSLLAETS
jgi:dTDP-4-amino-4,6-dideoxygalactose transaminase